MKKALFYGALLSLCILGSYKWYDISQKKERIAKLGKDLLHYSRSESMNSTAFPADVVFVGKKTFWELFEITAPIDSIAITVHLGFLRDTRADFLLDIGAYLGLRIRYDSHIDKFHIIGYQSALTAFDEGFPEKARKLNSKLYKIGYITPHSGLIGMEIGKSTKSDIFTEFHEKHYNEQGIKFAFDANDRLEKLYISTYQLQPAEDIRFRIATIEELTEKFGAPDKIETVFRFKGRTLRDVEILVYPGISYVFLQNTLMAAVVR